MAKNSKEYYNLMYGDKDSYHLSFRSHNIPFHLVDFHPGIGGYLAPNPFHSGTSDFVGLGMIQRHPNNGSPLFLHSTLKEFEGADINNPHAFKRFTHFQVLDQKVPPKLEWSKGTNPVWMVNFPSEYKDSIRPLAPRNLNLSEMFETFFKKAYFSDWYKELR